MENMLPKKFTVAAVILILVIGFIHLFEARHAFEEMPMLGYSFIANCLAAIVAAVGIYRGARLWGWALGALIAGGSLVGYIVKATMGMPGMPPEADAWTDPVGITSVIAEVLFLVIFAFAWKKSLAPVR